MWNSALRYLMCQELDRCRRLEPAFAGPHLRYEAIACYKPNCGESEAIPRISDAHIACDIESSNRRCAWLGPSRTGGQLILLFTH